MKFCIPAAGACAESAAALPTGFFMASVWCGTAARKFRVQLAGWFFTQGDSECRNCHPETECMERGSPARIYTTCRLWMQARPGESWCRRGDESVLGGRHRRRWHAAVRRPPSAVSSRSWLLHLALRSSLRHRDIDRGSQLSSPPRSVLCHASTNYL